MLKNSPARAHAFKAPILQDLFSANLLDNCVMLLLCTVHKILKLLNKYLLHEDTLVDEKQLRISISDILFYTSKNKISISCKIIGKQKVKITI